MASADLARDVDVASSVDGSSTMSVPSFGLVANASATPPPLARTSTPLPTIALEAMVFGFPDTAHVTDFGVDGAVVVVTAVGVVDTVGATDVAAVALALVAVVAPLPLPAIFITTPTSPMKRSAPNAPAEARNHGGRSRAISRRLMVRAPLGRGRGTASSSIFGGAFIGSVLAGSGSSSRFGGFSLLVSGGGAIPINVPARFSPGTSGAGFATTISASEVRSDELSSTGRLAGNGGGIDSGRSIDPLSSSTFSGAIFGAGVDFGMSGAIPTAPSPHGGGRVTEPPVTSLFSGGGTTIGAASAGGGVDSGAPPNWINVGCLLSAGCGESAGGGTTTGAGSGGGRADGSSAFVIGGGAGKTGNVARLIDEGAS